MSKDYVQLANLPGINFNSEIPSKDRLKSIAPEALAAGKEESKPFPVPDVRFACHSTFVAFQNRAAGFCRLYIVHIGDKNS